METSHKHQSGYCDSEVTPSDYHKHINDYLGLPDCRHIVHYIRMAQNERGVKSVLLLSQFQKEGKTFFAAMLAAAASRLLHQRVLVVDAVFACPQESTLYNLLHLHSDNLIDKQNKSAGLIDIVLAKQILFDRASGGYTYSTNTQGSHSASDFEIGEYLVSARNNYDLILIDGCALNTLQKDSLHPSILAFYSDATIVVASSRGLARSSLESLKRILSHQQICPFGLVFNRGG